MAVTNDFKKEMAKTEYKVIELGKGRRKLKREITKIWC